MIVIDANYWSKECLHENLISQAGALAGFAAVDSVAVPHQSLIVEPS